MRVAARWCPGRGSNPYALFREAADFKSAVSASFTTRAGAGWIVGDAGTQAGGPTPLRTRGAVSVSESAHQNLRPQAMPSENSRMLIVSDPAIGAGNTLLNNDEPVTEFRCAYMNEPLISSALLGAKVKPAV